MNYDQELKDMQEIDKLISHFSGNRALPIRLYPTNSCNYRCRTPFSTCFCDHIYTQSDNPPAKFIEIARLFRKNGLSNIAKVSGREPTLYPGLLPLVDGLSNVMDKVTLSTNGSASITLLDQCIERGVSLVTIPIPSLSPSKYSFFIGCDDHLGERYFNDVMGLIRELGKRDVELHLIRVIMKGFNDTKDEMEKFLEFSRDHGAVAKIFDLNYHPRLNVQICKGSMQTRTPLEGKDAQEIWKTLYFDLAPLKRNLLARSVRVEEYINVYSSRKVIMFKLEDGTKVLMDDLIPIKPTEHSTCGKCAFKNVCKEGFYSNGWEITPDLKLQPCPMRADLAIDLHDAEDISSINYEGGILNVQRHDDR